MRPKMFSIFTPQFYVCPVCHNRMIAVKDRSLQKVICQCGQPMTELLPNAVSDSEYSAHRAIFTFTGGLKRGALHLEIGEKEPHSMTEAHHIEWIYLQGRQGTGQFYCLWPGHTTKAVFGLAGIDAYAYCDREVCKMGNGCKFRCRGDFDIYVYCNRHGLWKLTT